jgi:hypothetical protein
LATVTGRLKNRLNPFACRLIKVASGVVIAAFGVAALGRVVAR